MISQREKKWRSGNTIMLDLFNGRERHVYMESLQVNEVKGSLVTPSPSLREFGPQSEDDLIDSRIVESFEKLLPVLNGLIYQKQGKNLYNIFISHLKIQKTEMQY